jgi:uncharacterized protein
MSHSDTIGSIYAAFGSGNVAHILDRVTDGTRWDFSVAPDSVAWHRPVEGKSTLPAFFAAMGENIAIERFEPHSMVTQGNHVAVRVNIAYTVKSTGRKVAMEQVHWWTLTPEGKVDSLRHFEDTAQVARATQAG